jgi:hypothetical protein
MAYAKSRHYNFGAAGAAGSSGKDGGQIDVRHAQTFWQHHAESLEQREREAERIRSSQRQRTAVWRASVRRGTLKVGGQPAPGVVCGGVPEARFASRATRPLSLGSTQGRLRATMWSAALARTGV